MTKRKVNDLITWSPKCLVTSAKRGFTLAEVLITLAIIGVVAAMTIPTLISNYKKQVVETRLARFYSAANQALKLSMVDNGEFTTWDKMQSEKVLDSDGKELYKKTTNSLEWTNKYIAPYMKILKIEEVEKDKNGLILVYFLDGSMVAIGSSSWLYYPYASDWSNSIYDETTGVTDRDRTASGIKYFTFFFDPNTADASMALHKNKGVEPYMGLWNGTTEMLKNNAVIGCNENATNERAYCTKLIQLNNWKIPEDYPFKF